MNNRNLEDYEEKYNDKDHYDFETFQIEFRRRNTLTLINKNIHGTVVLWQKLDRVLGKNIDNDFDQKMINN